MESKRIMLVCGLFILSLSLTFAPTYAADPPSQITVDYESVLKANPMPAGEKAQAIRITGDGTATVLLARFLPGAEVKPHYHKTHSEMVYVIEGTALMVIDGKTVTLKPGSIHFNPMSKVHSVKNTGTGQVVVLQMFTPAWTAPDRVPAP